MLGIFLRLNDLESWQCRTNRFVLKKILRADNGRLISSQNSFHSSSLRTAFTKRVQEDWRKGHFTHLKSVRDFFWKKGFLRTFHGFFLKIKGFLLKVYEIFGSECSSVKALVTIFFPSTSAILLPRTAPLSYFSKVLSSAVDPFWLLAMLKW